jgi:hypothetical protein
VLLQLFEKRSDARLRLSLTLGTLGSRNLGVRPSFKLT